MFVDYYKFWAILLVDLLWERVEMQCNYSRDVIFGRGDTLMCIFCMGSIFWHCCEAVLKEIVCLTWLAYVTAINERYTKQNNIGLETQTVQHL